MAASTDNNVRWVPLESNPEVLTKYTRELGVTKGEWQDVFALDEETLVNVPQPVLAVILLFPISDQYDAFAKEQDESLKEKGQEVAPDLYYMMKQTITNACGTYGLLHALGNNAKELNIQDGVLKEFLDETNPLDPLERGKALGNSEKIAAIHERIAEEGQTAAPDREENLVTHFVTFVHKDGNLYELDGRRAGPVNHGPTNANDLLKDAAVVCKSRMERDPTEYRFTVVALTAAQ